MIKSSLYLRKCVGHKNINVGLFSSRMFCWRQEKSKIGILF